MLITRSQFCWTLTIGAVLVTGDELTLPVSSRLVTLTFVHTDQLPPP